MSMITYKYRVKDKHASELNTKARAVNFVWNFCNNTQKHALKWGKKWPSGYDLEKLTAGSSKELGIPSEVISKVCQQYHQSRKQFKKPCLRYRGKKSLGWVPVRARTIRKAADGISCNGKVYSLWLSRIMPDNAKICDGSNFSQDKKGRWYLNIVIDVPANENVAKEAVGIDLGLKDIAVMSGGEAVAAPQYYRTAHAKLAKAQRAKKKRQVTAIHARIANQRKDFLHKLSTDIVLQYGFIAIGNVNSSKLKKTRMAKSVSDAGWSSFRNMLAYKSDYAGAIYVEVNENFTTQTCSDCGVIGGPKGREGLGVREWVCECGSVHDRDVNSAKNILRLGHQTLTGAAV